MDTSTVILQVAVILMAARIMGELAAYLGAPAVIGEIVAGIILGPTLLGFAEATGLIQILAEIGIILLLFQVGLETDIGELARSGMKSVIVAITGFVVPFVSCFMLSYYFFLDVLDFIARRRGPVQDLWRNAAARTPGATDRYRHGDGTAR